MGQLSQDDPERKVDGEQPPDASDLYSFYTEDSYSLIVAGPDPAKLKPAPANIPKLDLNNLPQYESSDEEEAAQDGQSQSNQEEAKDSNQRASMNE